MNNRIKVLMAAGLALALHSAFAQDVTPDKPAKPDRAARVEKMKEAKAEFDKRFTEADADHDGKLSREEAKKMPRIAEHFDEIDSAKTGFITKDQVMAFTKKQMAAHRRQKPAAS